MAFYKLRVEIARGLGLFEFVTGGTIGRRGQHSRVGRMTGKTRSVSDGRGFKGALFEPKIIAKLCGRFRDIFIARFALRLIGLMTDGAAFFRRDEVTRPGRI
jgi:hypothetical protein